MRHQWVDAGRPTPRCEWCGCALLADKQNEFDECPDAPRPIGMNGVGLPALPRDEAATLQEHCKDNAPRVPHEALSIAQGVPYEYHLHFPTISPTRAICGAPVTRTTLIPLDRWGTGYARAHWCAECKKANDEMAALRDPPASEAEAPT